MKRVKIKYNLLKYTKLERQNILDPPLGNVYVLDDMHTPEFWTQLLHMDFLINNLKLKIGVSIILLKNINQSSELWNETWLIITQLDNHVWETKVISSCKIGKKKVFIPRLSLLPYDPRISFKFQRKQFSVMFPFAMTIK